MNRVSLAMAVFVIWTVYATLAYVGLIDEGRAVAKILLGAFQEIADLVHF